MLKSNSISFDLEIVHGMKNLCAVDVARVLIYLKSIFIYAKVTSAEITDHFGGKHCYREGDFLRSIKPTQTSIWSDEPSASCVWKGIVYLKSNQLGDLVKNTSRLEGKNGKSYGFFWKFDENYLKFHQVIDSTSSKSLRPAFFSLGNIVNGNYFVSHFDSNLCTKIKDLNVELVPHKNELNFMFTLINNKVTGKEVKLSYDCNSIKSGIIHDVEPLGFLFYAHLAYAPKMFSRDISCCKIGKKYTQWKRVNSCSLIPQDLLGNCNVLRFSCYARDTSYIPAFYYWRRHMQFDLSFGTIVLSKNLSQSQSTNNKFPERIQYALACIKSLGYNYQDDLQINHQGEAIINEFIEKQINGGKCEQIYRALNKLYDALANDKVHNVFEHLKYLLDKVELDWELIKDQEQDTELIKYIRPVILTPSRSIFMPPVMTRTSKFLDMAESDCVLRIIYQDENHGPLNSTFRNFGPNRQAKTGDEEDVNVVTSMLKHRIPESGLIVAGRAYQYFGASPSQLKGGGMILYCKDSKNRTAASIRDSLGIVKEKNVPKYMSRVGLSLSQVMALVDLPECTNIYLSTDIYGYSADSDKHYNFTDGCGSMSIQIARYIYEDLIRQEVMERKSDENYMPSAFQIRFMGSKGMLVIDPDLTGMTIVIRESMHKMYTSIDYRIGIVKASEPRRAYLNKNFILILNQIGLSNDFFINFIKSTLNELKSLHYDEKVALLTMKMYSHLHRLVNLDAFATCNFSFTSDSFFKSVLNFAEKKAFDDLKTSQRIPLPWFEARTMFGVCDTTAKSQKWLADQFVKQGICKPNKFAVDTTSHGTGVLKEGQIFFWPSDYSAPYRGEVIVSKSPMNDLGNVRKMVAVDCKELHHIRDCIAFPVDGKRPHQDQMAGSDLDGDEYCVIWMEDFLDIKEQMAVEYPDKPKGTTESEISDELMIEHHIKCVEADQVGQLSNAQLAHADREGFDSPKCKSIGAKCNEALDAPKNGINCENFITKEEKAQETPDYMGKWSITPTYYSTTAPGEIYRFVNLSLLTSESSNMLTRFEPDSDIDERLLHPRMLKYIEFAAEILQFYESIVNHLLTRHGLKLEIELFTGILDGPTSLHNQASRFKDKEDAMVAVIKSLLINKMDKVFESKMINASEDDKMAAASAIYYVSKQKVKDANSHIGLPFIGKCGLYLRRFLKSQKVNTKDQDKMSSNLTTNAIAPLNQHYIRLPIIRIKEKIKNISKTFLSYNRKFVPEALVSSTINKIISQDDLNAISPENLIPKLIKETKKVWTDLAGIENNQLDRSELLNSTIPTLIWSLLANETYLPRTQKEKSDNISKSFLVRYCKRGNHSLLWELLKETLTPDTQIEILSDSKEKNCIPVVIFGSPSSIWVSQIIIGIHNRLCSIIFNNYAT